MEEGHDVMEYKEEAEEEGGGYSSPSPGPATGGPVLEDPRACCGCVRARWRESVRDLKKNLRRIFRRHLQHSPGLMLAALVEEKPFLLYEPLSPQGSTKEII